MADILDTILIQFDDDDDSDVTVKFDYDHELNTYGTGGEAVTTFYTDEDIYLLVQLEPGYVISRIDYTSGGVSNLGLVTRTEEVTDHFFPDNEEQSLSWYPSGSITIDSDHLQTGTQTLTVTDDKVTCSNPPSILDYHYDFKAYSLRVRHPSAMDLEDDDTFPLGIVIEATK
jgi:hypothetical protein